MNGNQDEPSEPIFEDPLGLIQPIVPPEVQEPISFCDECGSIGMHSQNCPLARGAVWTQQHHRREAVLRLADESIPTLAARATRRVAARALRRIARWLEP